MQSKFPRLYVEPPELPKFETDMHFVARRWPFGPCTVGRQFVTNGEPGMTDHTIPADWHKEGDAEWIAREVLRFAKCRNDGDVPAKFAREVLAKLPRDGWVLTRSEVRAGATENAPEEPPVVWEPPPFEEQVRAMLRRAGMLGEEGQPDGDEACDMV